MIQFFQKYLNTSFGLAFVFIAVTVVAFLGIDFGGNSSYTNSAAVVDGQEISLNALTREIRNVEARYQEQLGENWGQFSQFLNIERQALDALIGRSLFVNFLSQLGFAASKPAISKQLEEIPFFENSVTKETMEQFLQAYGYTAKTFEKELVNAVKFDQFFGTVEALLIPTDKELESKYKKEKTKKKFAYTAFSSNDFREGLEVTDEALLEVFENRKEEYRELEKVSYVAAEFTATQAESLVPIDQDELKSIYEERKSEFVTPERFTYDEIIIAEKTTALPFGDEEDAASSVTEEELLSMAASIKAQADWDNFDASPFETENVKVVFSTDLRSKADSLVSEELTALKELKDGESSEALVVGDAVKVLRRKSYEAQEQLPFNEVRIEIEQEIRKLDAPSYMRLSANKFYEELLSQAPESAEDFAEKAQELKSDILKTSKPLGEGEFVKDNLTELTSLALKLETTAVEKHQEKDRVFVVYVSEKVPSYIPEFESLKPRLKASYTQQKSSELAKQKAEETLAQIKESSFSEVIGTEHQKTELKILAEAEGEIFNDPSFKENLYALKNTGDVFEEVLSFANKNYIVKLEEIELPDEREISEKSSELRKQYVEQAKSRLEQNILASLRLRKQINETPGVVSR